MGNWGAREMAMADAAAMATMVSTTRHGIKVEQGEIAQPQRQHDGFKGVDSV